MKKRIVLAICGILTLSLALCACSDKTPSVEERLKQEVAEIQEQVVEDIEQLADAMVGGNQQETPEQETPKQETPKQETPKQETPKQETPKQETPKQETPKQETPKQETPKQETPKQETPKQETPKQETPTQPVPTPEPEPQPEPEPVVVNEFYKPDNNVITAGDVTIRPYHIYWENGALVAKCYIINGTNQTVNRLIVDWLHFNNNKGVFASAIFNEVQIQPIAPGCHINHTFRFLGGGVDMVDADLTGNVSTYFEVRYQ